MKHIFAIKELFKDGVLAFLLTLPGFLVCLMPLKKRNPIKFDASVMHR